MIEINIYQPRLDNISTWEISVKDLLDWAENELKPKAAMAYKGEGDFNPGKHCGFCRAKPVCRALAEYNLELEKMEFKSADLLSDEEVIEILEKRDQFKKWLEAVSLHILNSAIEGKQWPGYKVVLGRSNRKYSDEIAIGEKLKFKGYTDVFKPAALLNLTEMEKKLTKPVFKELVEPMLIKPDGRPTLTVESDPREVFKTNHADDFISYDDED